MTFLSTFFKAFGVFLLVVVILAVAAGVFFGGVLLGGMIGGHWDIVYSTNSWEDRTWPSGAGAVIGGIIGAGVIIATCFAFDDWWDG